MKPKSPTQVEQAHALIADLTMLHYRAMQCGLYKTGQKLHEAVKQSGWELAEWIEDLRAENEKLAALDEAREVAGNG